jgi:uncharacterized cupin superfamily protein
MIDSSDQVDLNFSTPFDQPSTHIRPKAVAVTIVWSRENDRHPLHQQGRQILPIPRQGDFRRRRARSVEQRPHERGLLPQQEEGGKNEWVVTYDEVLVVTKGALTIRTADGAKTAKAGEIIFLTKGTALAYEAGEDDTEVVYVSYPHWMDAQQRSQHAHLLNSYHPVHDPAETV